ncbi:MAG TPA: hypothetical protein VIW70_13270 [Rubrivivax sp.]
MDEFEDVDFVARRPMTPTATGNASTRERFVIARVVSRVYRAASDATRADMLAHLLRPLGVLGLVSVASGAFARFVRRDGLVPETISAEDIVRYSSEQIRELTMFVHEVDPDALQALLDQMAQNGMGIAALATVALVLLRRRSRERPPLSSRTVSSLDRLIGNHPSERT